VQRRLDRQRQDAAEGGRIANGRHRADASPIAVPIAASSMTSVR
jgi:hypothetical protein